MKEKTDDELLVHYGLAKSEVLTSLGVSGNSWPQDSPTNQAADVAWNSTR
ncbi:hypothetical protein ACFL5O_08110 [Myxococcota bacterium]